MDEKKPIPRKFEYINVTRKNIFTEQGRCMPGEKVRMYAKEAKVYKGLKKCVK